ncbi:MAG: hypothetical protein M1830_004691 [Pleopsidium flavum]|nr:MAG: hypothetical protein M1830_004691 [Pleopsidium flavum]
MLDPFLSPPAFITALAQPIADFFGLTTLPLHAHEVLAAFLFYHTINIYVSPMLSRWLFPKIYASLPRRTKLNWDVHVVSLVQSSLINILALWIIWTDEERKSMSWPERVWGYTGGGGMIQGFAAGYFLWDLVVSSMNVGVFGWGMLAHAIAALVVFSLGFRPFVNYYGPTFILYELSSPFLNFHWFFDKVNMTGSRAQLYNGILLLGSFFSCRLVWGTYQSIRVYQDVWAALQIPGTPVPIDHGITSATEKSVNANSEIMRFAGDKTVPIWLACTYLGSNIVLNTLNFYWFGKMIETVKKRFQPPKERRGKAAMAMDGTPLANGKTESEERVRTVVDGTGKRTVIVEKREFRRRKA